MKLETREQLDQHILNHKGKDVPLFGAFGRHGFVLDETIKSHKKISIKPVHHADGSFSEHPFIHLDGQYEHSLHDRHLDGPQDYNDNWWFTTREEAEAYIKKD